MAAKQSSMTVRFFEVKVPLNICIPTFLAATQEKLFTLPLKLTHTTHKVCIHCIFTVGTPYCSKGEELCRDLLCLTA